MSFALYNRLHVHIAASNREVIRACWRKIEPRQRRNAKMRSVRKSFYRDMLSYHLRSRRLADQFRL